MTCNDVYERHRERFKSVPNSLELVSFLQDVAKEHISLCHFTTMDAFAKIYKEGLWRFSSAYRMNDLQELMQKGEKDKWKHIYSVSFSHGDFNNIGMWKMYGGNCNHESICLEFSADSVKEWETTIKQEHQITTNNNDLCSHAGLSTSFHDIAYIHGWQERGWESVCWGSIINSRIPQESIVSQEPILTGFIKNSAWEQEKESRILLELPQEKQHRSVFVPIYSLFNNFRVHFSPFTKANMNESIQLLRIFFSSNNAPWPTGLENRCSCSYFKGLLQ